MFDKLRISMAAVILATVAALVILTGCGGKSSSSSSVKKSQPTSTSAAVESTESSASTTSSKVTTAASTKKSKATTTAVTTKKAHTTTAAATTKKAKTTTTAKTTTKKVTTTQPATKNDAYVSYTFRNDKLLNQHFEKHGSEFKGDFNYRTAKDYEKGASDVINDPDALFKYEAEDGDEVYYLEETNEFVILSTDGYIRTYFRPNGGKNYFDRQ